jgi:hypothetical protein
VLIFAVSEKDMAPLSAENPDGPRFNYVKKDGTPGYMQPLPADRKNLKPMTQHAYVAVTPTVNFRVKGADANSASQIRKEYVKGNDADREQIIADLYGEMDPEIKDMFDRNLGVGQQLQNIIKEAREKNPARALQLLETIKKLERAAHGLNEFAPSPGYGDDSGDDDYIPRDLMHYANIWWNAADPEVQAYIEDQMASGGWMIAQVDSDDDAVQITHRDGTTYFISADEFDPDLHEDSDYIEEKWSQKYKRSINCNNPKGFSQRAHCAGRKK